MTDKFDPPVKDDTARARLLTAYRNFEAGNADKADSRLILQHLSMLTGYYTGFSVKQWIEATGSANGFEHACIEQEARRWVFSQILPFLTQHADGRLSDK